VGGKKALYGGAEAIAMAMLGEARKGAAAKLGLVRWWQVSAI